MAVIKSSKMYRVPRRPYEKERLDHELRLIGTFGLRNKREVWRTKLALAKIRKAARIRILASNESEKVLFDWNALARRLCKYGILQAGSTTPNDVLNLKVEDLLRRRLQTIVFEKRLASSIHNARVLIASKHISIAGKVVNVPSYMTKVDEESLIGFSPRSVFSGAPRRKKKGKKASEDNTDEMEVE